MASCKFEGGKCHGASASKAMLRHSDITPTSRAIAAKENPHIDISKSHLNKSIDGLTLEQKFDKYNKRLAELDATTNTNKRKDRVTMQNIEIPVPKDLDRKNYNKWFVRIATILGDTYGYKNMIDGGSIHYDEEHEYISAETGKSTMSRVHCHYSIIPEFDGSLNGHKMHSRANMRKLNKLVDDMTRKEFNCAFMDGTKRKSKKSVEELKNISSQLEALQAHEQIKQLQAEESRLAKEKTEFEAYTVSKEQALQDREQNIKESVKDIEGKAVDYYNRAKNLYNSLSRESEDFKVNKGTLYHQSLQRAERSKIDLDESLLPQSHNKQKERDFSL